MGLEIAIGAAIAGAIASVTGGVVGGIEAHNQAEYEAKVAERNARMLQAQHEYNQRAELREAAALEAESRENIRRMREEAARIKALQRAQLGKAGAAMASGSPLAILGESAADEELKIQDSHYTAARQIAQRKSAANVYGYQARIAGHNAKTAANSPYPRLILQSPHPSPLSSYRGFFGSRPFSQINDFLKAHGQQEIQW